MKPFSQDELDLLESYIDAGFYLFPVANKSKVPLIKNMLEVASNDMEQFLKWREQYKDCGFGLSLAKSGLWALDVDHNHNGMEKWATMALSLGEPDTLMQKTGSGGYHFIFKHVEGMQLKGKITPGIDIKYNGFIVLSPATNKDGDNYVWPRGFNSKKIKPLELDWLLSLVNKEIKEIPMDLKPADVKESVVKQAADHLKEETLDYADWLTVGMAFHAYNSGAEGLEYWLTVTQGAGYKDGDLQTARNKWDSFKARTDGIGIASLFYIVREYCGYVPNLSLDYDKIGFRKPFEDEVILEKDIYKEFYSDGSGSLVCWHKEFIVDWINKSYALLSKGMVAKITYRNDGTKTVSTMRKDDFKTEIQHLKLVFEVVLESGTVRRKYLSAADVWLEHTNRRCYERVVFEPPEIAGPNELNLWSDIPCIAKSGDVSLFQEFILIHVCNGSRKHYDWLIQWLAHKVQHLDVKSTVVPIFQGPQGTGKGLLTDGFLRGIYGGLYHKIMSSSRLTNQFNMAQAYRQMVIIDEATWYGNKTEEALLKSLTGSEVQTVEEKFGASLTIRNSANYIITTNSHVGASITKDNRRFQPFEMKKLPKGQSAIILKKYWDALKSEGYIENVYDFLLNEVDVTEFDPFTSPQLEGGDIAKIRSEGAVSMFLHDLFFEEPRELFIDGTHFDKTAAYDSLLGFLKSIRSHERNVSKQHFSQALSEIYPKTKEQQMKFGDYRAKVLEITPEDMVAGYCGALGIKKPDRFEGLDYFLSRSDII